MPRGLRRSGGSRNTATAAQSVSIALIFAGRTSCAVSYTHLDVYKRQVAELLYAQLGAEAFPLAAAFYRKPKTTIRVNTLRTDDARCV